MFRFRLSFVLPEDTFIGLDEHIVDVAANLAGGPYVIKAPGDQAKIKDSGTLILNSRGFPSEEAAWDAGRRAKAALVVAAAKLRIGIDTGRDTPRGGFGATVIEDFRSRGIELRSDVHGLTVYDDSAETVFASVTARASVGKAGQTFLSTLSQALSGTSTLSAKQLLAFELYSFSHFEASPRAKFLTLVTVIEALTEDRERSAKAVAHVDDVINQTEKADLEKDERASLLGAMQWLRIRSIGQKTKTLVKKALPGKVVRDMPAEKFFAACYEIRSRVVHAGENPQEVSDWLSDLDELVSELLVNSIPAA